MNRIIFMALSLTAATFQPIFAGNKEKKQLLYYEVTAVYGIEKELDKKSAYKSNHSSTPSPTTKCEPVNGENCFKFFYITVAPLCCIGCCIGGCIGGSIVLF